MTCDIYLEQAKSNEKAARSIEADYPDWAVTMCFYAALHWVEYYACVSGFDIHAEYKADDKESLHTSRRKYVDDISQELGNPNLRKAYAYLEQESRKARYLQNLSTNAKVYYTKNRFTVTDSFQKLQQIKQLLSS
ncbi:hypothetical protein PN497_10975 [Sphaerospermopsis kisseleviana CS-549]|uniref:HEPN domain-containing protein n=1 Tax=Sphaerospermopsis kisseleviana CS-549 TaxID=3021783 RepID=A0ABT4ZS91_9CYAN|nr:hypothetical protein [Sphaerospermopsis kisseleviana]MDB9441879.1 hypothetical protein [Sphaerospermopsis kisseleviana CS-549]BAZ81403.1 hypothetical protein NIES73_26710 [Sphaerospermopsis kisseleviana NIES-73]